VRPKQRALSSTLSISPDITYDRDELLARSFIGNIAADLHSRALDVNRDIAREAEPLDLLADRLRTRIGVSITLENFLCLRH
jgi:hypothetical protein